MAPARSRLMTRTSTAASDHAESHTNGNEHHTDRNLRLRGVGTGEGKAARRGSFRS
jgi:hypothetical protein